MYLEIAAIIIVSVSAFFTGMMYLVTKRDKKRPLILEIVNNFLKPTKDKLNRDKIHLKTIDVTSFPNFISFRVGIPTHSLSGANFDRFIKWKPLLKRQILKYNGLCVEVNEKINELDKVAKKEKFITQRVNKEGARVVIAEQYENKEIMKIMEEKGLNKNIEYIEHVIQRQGLDMEAGKLIQKLEKEIRKLQDKYNLAGITP